MREEMGKGKGSCLPDAQKAISLENSQPHLKSPRAPYHVSLPLYVSSLHFPNSATSFLSDIPKLKILAMVPATLYTLSIALILQLD